MKLADIEKVNHLVHELEDVRRLIVTAEGADTSRFQLLIEAGGDSSLKMSEEGSSTTHYRGIDVTAGFLTKLKKLAITELHEKQQRIVKELSALGVEAD